MIKSKLYELIDIVVEETERNPDFKTKVQKVLNIDKDIPKTAKKTTRKKAIVPTIDPIDIVKQGKATLIKVLEEMDIMELKSIVKYYAMDTSRSYTRWKKKDRFINLIVEVSLLRSKKGEGFI